MIDNFKGPHAFLSNFYVERDGLTAEHRFQAVKARTAQQAAWVLAAPTAGEAKKRGRKVELIPGWDELRLMFMSNIVANKFRDPTLRNLLISTGDEILVEGNWWGDRYWGVDFKTRVGENHLGAILMAVRASLR